MSHSTMPAEIRQPALRPPVTGAEPSQPAGPRPYAAPRLRRLGDGQALLELLGPAQANYQAP